jgi:hypothetical protein
LPGLFYCQERLRRRGSAVGSASSRPALPSQDFL